ncbi:MAG: copper amine oxidase N-terminal domain-containing protein [Bacillota bacterium]
MFKKIAVIACIITLIAALAGVALAGETIKIFINGKEIKSDVPAQIISGRTMVPVRFVSEALGAEVKWEETSQSVLITTQKSKNLNLLTVDGEKTTWPYWYESGNLYMEYRNVLELLRFINSHSNNNPRFYKATGNLYLGDKVITVNTSEKNGFTAINVSFLKDNHRLLNYDFNPETGEMKVLPIK